MVGQIDFDYFRRSPGRSLRRLVSYGLFEGRPLTTRGRWINPLLFGSFELYRRLPQLREIRAPIFIVGMGRSGTTILGVVLSIHRDVGFLNEPKAIWHAICGTEDLVGSYTDGLAKYRLTAAEATAEMKCHAHRLFGAYLGLTRANRLCDKYPELVFRTGFVRALFPDARFIFLIRNGWDACMSIGCWSESKGRRGPLGVEDWWGRDRRKWQLLLGQVAAKDSDLAPHIEALARLTDQRAMAAVEWLLTMREGLRRMTEVGLILVRYEDLAASPEKTVGRLLRCLDLPADPACLSYARSALRPAESRGRFELPGYLAGPFARTMTDLGYRS